MYRHEKVRIAADVIYSRHITGSYRLTVVVGFGGMWLTSSCGWVCRGAAAVMVTVAFCVLCCFEMQKSFELQEKRGSLWNRVNRSSSYVFVTWDILYD